MEIVRFWINFAQKFATRSSKMSPIRWFTLLTVCTACLTAEEQYAEIPFCSIQYNWLNVKSEQCDAVRFGDGSQWKISQDYIEEVKTWEPGDTLIISPNYTLLAEFSYWIKNKRTNNYVLAHLLYSPQEFGEASHWVRHVEPAGAYIYLENRLGFEIDPRDRWLSEEWEANDVIIVGSSNSWFSSYDYILFNTTLNHYVRAKIY